MGSLGLSEGRLAPSLPTPMKLPFPLKLVTQPFWSSRPPPPRFPFKYVFGSWPLGSIGQVGRDQLQRGGGVGNFRFWPGPSTSFSSSTEWKCRGHCLLPSATARPGIRQLRLTIGGPIGTIRPKTTRAEDTWSTKHTISL